MGENTKTLWVCEDSKQALEYSGATYGTNIMTTALLANKVIAVYDLETYWSNHLGVLTVDPNYHGL